MMRAGDRRPALEALQRLPEASQFGVLGKLAADQLNDGDRVGADETIAMIETLQAKNPQEGNYEIALSQVGRALATQGDAGRARTFADKIGSKILRPNLLGEIAKAQHKAGDQKGAEATIRQLREETEVASGGDPLQVARAVAVAAAGAGNLDVALALVAAVPNKQSQDGLLAQLGGSLARAGKFADARRVADISGDLGSLMLIGEGQQRAGRCDEARVTFQAGQEALARAPLQPFERTRETQRVIRGLVGCGFFAEALVASQGLDELNRLIAIRSVIREEVKRGDMQALRATVPVALRLIQAAAAPDLPILGDIVTALAKAGLIDEAKAVWGKDPRVYGVMTKKFIGDKDRHVRELLYVDVEWVKGPDGRFGPREIPGTEKVIQADLVLLAMGFLGPEKPMLTQLGVKLDERGNVWTDQTKMTSVPGVFAAGDMSRGQSLVVWAIKEGRQAAQSMDRYLSYGETVLTP